LPTGCPQGCILSEFVTYQTGERAAHSIRPCDLPIPASLTARTTCLRVRCNCDFCTEAAGVMEHGEIVEGNGDPAIIRHLTTNPYRSVFRETNFPVRQFSCTENDPTRPPTGGLVVLRMTLPKRPTSLASARDQTCGDHHPWCRSFPPTENDPTKPGGALDNPRRTP